jgi:hypothetical protein
MKTNEIQIFNKGIENCKTLSQNLNFGDYNLVAARFNGLCTPYFRFFGTEKFADFHSNIFELNNNPFFTHNTKSDFTQDTFFVFGEDILGDLYCFSHEHQKVAKVYCEDITVEYFASSSILSFIEEFIIADYVTFLDTDFLATLEAFPQPSFNEHYSFILPLTCGGEYNAENVEICDRFTHWDFLAQVIKVTQSLSENIIIKEFKTKS